MGAIRTSFGVADVKARFSELLDRVERGETITVSKHGRTVAKLVPAPQERSADQRKAGLHKYLEGVRRRGQTLGKDLSIRQLINEGREGE
jgi:prevent-host-death family protein